ncbi:hypothetical protein ZV79_2872 [Salmonella enterica subsp. enterica serovar Typhimurium]|nr:hypothetical protein ZV79_2872 [Salmonella enterica subsp. enterica serovar Typhimurium]
MNQIQSSRIAVYPRWRGEHGDQNYHASVTGGLSPLARGTPRVVPVVPGSVRFIPAGAGNTEATVWGGYAISVYPRWRGEHFVFTNSFHHSPGLSPLARGTHADPDCNHGQRRFIPAGAGNTVTSATLRAINAVYPRWRGEHQCGQNPDQHIRGLSPLARGTLLLSTSPPRPHRFIPAGAGNTDCLCSASSACAVYPRWRGEHTLKSPVGGTVDGLSPLARGTLYFTVLKHFNSRFIPAGAGNTAAVVVPDTNLLVYPRWRGEHAERRTPDDL